LNFLSGVYYVKLSAYNSTPKEQDALQLIARKAEFQLHQSNTLPKILQALPYDDRVLNTEQYIAKNFLGYNFLSNAVTVEIKNEISFKDFIIETENPAAATVMFESLLKAVPKDSISKSDDGIWNIRDPKNGLITITQKKKYLYGVINCTYKSYRDFHMEEMNATVSRL